MFTKIVSLLLVPVLLGFSIQGTLEVAHPIEEDPARGHTHSTDGTTLSDSAECGLGSHPSHYCPHSNALARVAEPALTFQVDLRRNEAHLTVQFPAARLLRDVVGRSPPFPG